ncbi:hypothetical protein TRIATDRAFT_133509, partial [Trichoderma atroviride IMI 206040]
MQVLASAELTLARLLRPDHSSSPATLTPPTGGFCSLRFRFAAGEERLARWRWPGWAGRGWATRLALAPALALAVAPLLCAYIKGAFRPLSRRPTWTNVHPYSTPSSGHVTPPVTTPADTLRSSDATPRPSAR